MLHLDGKLPGAARATAKGYLDKACALGNGSACTAAKGMAAEGRTR